MFLGWVHELRMSARSLARTPVWTFTLVLTIALGIASNASVDGFVRGLQSPESEWPPEALAGIDRIGQLLRSAAIAVFVIACANVATFLLARSSARVRETAVRVAIGAGRSHLIRQVLADSLLVSLIGAITGAILAFWIGRVLPAWLFEEDARKMIFASDPSGVALIAGACAVITVVCGLLSLVETRDDPGAVIQRENSGPSRASIRLGTTLVTVQMTACTLLVISAGLLLAGFQSALRAGAGRQLSSAVLASIEVLQSSSKSEMTSSGSLYFTAAERAAREVVGATSIAWMASVPGNRPAWQSFEIEAPSTSRRTLTFEREPFTTRTIESLVLPPLQGRLFGTIDTGECGSVVLSAEAARRLGGERAVGRSIETAAGDWAEIVGVVRLSEEDRGRVYHYASNGDQPPLEGPAEYFVPEERDSAPRKALDVNVVSANYFAMMGLSTAAGRVFDEDTRGCRVAVVNEEADSRYFGGNAVGSAIIDRLGRRTNVIGVVRSIVLRAAQRAVEPALYLPISQDFIPRMTMIAETGGVSRTRLQELHRRIALIPGGREDRIIVKTLDDHLSRTALAPERIASVLVGASAAIALLLGMLGLYGIMSDAARRRQREFALRIALGARDGHVIGQVVAEGMRLVMAGVTVGLLASVLVAQWVSRIAPANEPLSLWIWFAAPMMLALAVVMAGVLPAKRALASSPLMIMKDDV